MRIFRRVMLSSGGLYIDLLPETQKLYYSATAKVEPLKDSLGSTIIYNEWDSITNKGVIVCSSAITTIKKNAFFNCNGLTSITIPDSVTSIGNDAFYYCSSLTSVTIPDSVTLIGSSTFSGCPGELIINSKIIETDYTSNNYPAKSDDGWLYGSKFTKLTIGNNITKIGSSTFRHYNTLTSVTIPDSVNKIGSGTFYKCSSLKSITIPDSVTLIREWAFAYCTSLTSITIPDSVTSIGMSIFYDCTSLTSVYCKATTPPSLGSTDVFSGNASGRKIYVPMESVDAYKSATNWSNYADYIVGYDFEQTTE